MGKNFIHKLGLGTVQFGLDYGVSNVNGKTPSHQVSEIIELAQRNDIRILDTARLYGDSETVIGNAVEKLHDKFDIITKTIPLKKETLDPYGVDAVLDGVRASLSSLKTNEIYGLLLHHADDLLSENADILYQALINLKESGRVKKIGVSVYNHQQIVKILDRYQIDLIQIPLNIFDQRLVENQSLIKLKEQGVEIHVRSAFLQGLFFMDVADLKGAVRGFEENLHKFHNWVNKNDITTIQGALSYVLAQKEVDKVICGVNNKVQLEQLIASFKSVPIFSQDIYDQFKVKNEDILNPSNW